MQASSLRHPGSPCHRAFFPSAGVSIKDIVLRNPDVTGVTIRYNWTDLEPTPDNYNWAFLDSEIARAAAAGKQVSLRIMTMAGRPKWVTKAAMQGGGKCFKWLDDDKLTTIPVFWDPTFLAKKIAMIAALGEHYTNNPAVTMVSASFANATSEDWNVPHSPDLVAQWLYLGYSTDNMLAAGQQIIDATMAAFPNQFVTLAVGGTSNDLDPTRDYVARTAVSTSRASWPGRLIVQRNDLSTIVPTAPGDGSLYEMIWEFQPDVAGQMVFHCVNDPTYKVNGGVPIDPGKALSESVKKGISYSEKYIEIYETDVVHLPFIITYANAALQASD